MKKRVYTYGASAGWAGRIIEVIDKVYVKVKWDYCLCGIGWFKITPYEEKIEFSKLKND